MKSISLTIALIIATIITLASCSKDRGWVKGHGSDVKNTRTTSAFTEISMAIDAKVELYPDSVYSLELVGQQNVLDVITTSSNGTTLTIDLKRHTELRNHNEVTIRVHMPRLTALDISGSGKIQSMQDFNIGNLWMNVSGSGDIYLGGPITGALTATISGSGNVHLTGISNCSFAKYTISGSGNMTAEWVKADNVDAKISGSGGLTMYAVKQLNANISGSGNVMYRGLPATNVSISGSGKLKSIN